jgi:hypothetical protein
MDIFHYHPDTGIYLGQGVADESPLEPGVWLIPAHATELEPPQPSKGKQIAWSGDSWDVQPIPEPETEPEPEPEPEPTPQPNYLAFWDALMVSSVYASIRTQSMASLPMNTLATEFIALLGDAKAGRPNEAAIQASITAILSTGTFDEEDLAEFAETLVAGQLADIYALD